MEDLLPYYERELTLLRQHARGFSEKYPKIAGRLQMAGESVEDPHVERLIESFALLAARVHKKLEDEYPEFTDALLQVLYPHYLKPFPSCSIARFDVGQGLAQLTNASCVTRETLLNTRPIKGQPCKFRTAFPLWLAPVQVLDVRYENVIRAPEKTSLPPQASGVISIDIGLQSEQAGFHTLGLPYLRLFMDADSALVSQLREALFHRTAGIMLEIDGTPARWIKLFTPVLRAVGYAEEEALIDFDARSPQAYRLLTEFFAFPEKFNFLDVLIEPLLRHLPIQSRRFTLHVLLQPLQEGGLDARLLEQLTARHLQTHCVPVVNLFKQHGEPIRLTHERSEYSVIPDHRRPYAFELYSLDSVYKVEHTAQGEAIHEYRPFYSLKHGDGPTQGRYWHLQCDENLAELSPGFEYQLSLVDINFDPATPKTETLSLELTCTNRDLPAQMPYGQSGGDLFMEGGSVARCITLLRKASPTYRFKRNRGGQWRLISHLSLNHFSLTAAGGDVLREALTLYNISETAQNNRMIEAVVDIQQKPAVARVSGNPFPVFLRGIEIHVTVREDGFVGTGLYLFAQVLDYFFGLYVHANSFTQLVFVSASTGEEILRCLPRNGELNLA